MATWQVRCNHQKGAVTISAAGVAFKLKSGAHDPDAACSPAELAADSTRVAFLTLGPRTRQLRITVGDGTTTRFNGFRRDDVAQIRALVQEHFGKDVAEVAPAPSGQNWGALDIAGDALTVTSHGDDGRSASSSSTSTSSTSSASSSSASSASAPALTLELLTGDVSQVAVRGQDGVEVQLEDRPMAAAEEQLTQIQFYVPFGHSGEYGAEDGATEDEVAQLATGAGRLRARLVEAAGIRGVTGEKILQLPDDVGTFLAPRGRYAVELYQKYFRMYGKQYDNRIFYEDIVSFFLLDNPNGAEQAFVITLKESKRLRMGNQQYQHLVLNCKANKSVSITIWPSPEQLIAMFGAKENGEPRIEQEYANVPLAKTVATLFKVISGKKVFVTGGFRSHRDAQAVRCALKNSDGLLYPTVKTLVFIHKPTLFLRYSDIQSIEFQRYEGAAGRAHTFDLAVSCRSIGGEPPRGYTFSSIDKKEYTNLLAFLHSKKGIEVKNLIQETGGRRGSHRPGQYAEDDADAAFHALGADSGGEENSADDSDFDANAAESSGDDSDDSFVDSDATGSESSDDDGGGGSSKKRKRKGGKKKKKKKKGNKENSKKTNKRAKKSPARKQKKMPKSDPNAPKRALSSFMLFGNKNRAAIKAANPDIAFGAVGRILGEQWRALTPEEKAPYEAEAAAAKAAYAEATKAYMESDERKIWEQDMMEEFGQIPGVKKAKAKKARAPKKEKKPKRARSAYAYFNQQERANIQAANPDATFAQMAGLLSAAWKDLPAADKQPFVDLAEQDKTRAAEEKAAWNEKVKKEREARGEVSSMSEDTSSSESESSEASGDDDGGAAAMSLE